MTKRNIGEEIVAGLQEIAAWKRGETKLKTTAMKLPRASDVAHIRSRTGLSQEAFAAFMGVSIGTLRNWEQGRRELHGPARALLLVADKRPQALREAFLMARETTDAT